MQTELAIAQRIQQTLVPVIDWQSSNLEIYGISLPSAEVGGDLVDVVPLSDGSVFAYVADVSGHGLPAGILMGMIKTAVRTQLFDLPSPTAVFERLNEVLPAVKESHMYATCTALRIQPDSNGSCRVEYAIAGQPAMLHASSASVAASPISNCRSDCSPDRRTTATASTCSRATSCSLLPTASSKPPTKPAPNSALTGSRPSFARTGQARWPPSRRRFTPRFPPTMRKTTTKVSCSSA